MVGRISKRTVDALTSTRSNVLLWDAQLPRFGLKVTLAGAKVYVVQYRVGRRLRRYTIGRHGAPWTPDTARKEALRLLALVEAGNDPVETKQSRRTASTIRDLAGRFLSEHVEAKCKA